MSETRQPVGHLEIVEQADGMTLIGGWVRLPPRWREPGAAMLHFRPREGAAVRLPLRRLMPRADLPANDLEPAGFEFQLVLRDQPRWTEATAEILLGGEALPMGPELLRPAAFRPRGHLDAADADGVSGWVLAAPGQRPTLVCNHGPAVPVTPNTDRPDLPFDDGRETPLFGFRILPEVLESRLQAVAPAIRLHGKAGCELALVVGGVELGQAVLRLEDGGPAAFPGTIASVPSQPGRVDLVLGGTRWATLPIRRDRRAPEAGLAVPGGGRVELPHRNPGEGASILAEARPPGGTEALAGARMLEGLPSWQQDRGGLLDALPVGDLPPVAILVPIHNAADDLARCILSVLRHTTGAARLLLLDDASTEPAVADLLRRWEGQPGIEVHRSARNLGFAGTINRGVALAGGDDVVLLNSDTVVGPGWLDGLRLAAHASPRVGTVTAVSNNAGAFSVPEPGEDNAPPAWFEAEDLARLARQSALALWTPVPTGHGFCLYVRRACLDAVGAFDAAAFPQGYGEENDFCLRAGRAGFEHLVDDRTLVWHRRSASFREARHPHLEAGRAVLAERYPEYASLVTAFEEDGALLAMRWRMRRALERTRREATTPRPRVLFVLSTRTGGTPQTNRDLMEALSDRYEAWVLHAEGQELELWRHGEPEPVERHRLDHPVRPGLHRSAEYDRRIADLLVRHGFELVHIRHLLWHGLGLPEVCRRLGIPVVLSFHDFYTVCPTIKLLDAERRFCAGHCTKGEAECRPELWPPASMPPLRNRFVHRWREMMAEAMTSCDAFVTTSPQARGILLDHFPQLRPAGIRLIPHGRSFAEFLSLAAEPTPEEPLRVLVPGNISAAKGGALIAALAELDIDRDIEFHVLGAVDAVLQQQRAGVVLHGRYERDGFADHVRRIRPHLAAVLSIWPETYCHTLTECWSVGLPVLGLRLGAVEERITAEGGGWLLDVETEPAAILRMLQSLKRTRGEIRARRDEVADWQQRLGRHYGSDAMAASYDQLYRELLDGRRSFRDALPGTPARVVAVLAPADAARGRRLPLPLRNSLARPFVFRRALPSHPFGEAAAGPADLALLLAGALRPRDLSLLLERCGPGGPPVMLEADARVASALLSSAERRAALAGRVVPMATDEEAAKALEAAGLAPLRLATSLDPAAWLAPVPPMPAPNGTVRLLCFADDPGLGLLRAHLGHLAALGVAETFEVEGPSADLSDPARFRAVAEGCSLLLLPGSREDLDGQHERALAGAAAALPVLRRAERGEAPGETMRGEVLLPPQPEAWVQAVAELTADPVRHGELSRRALRHAAALMSRIEAENALDAALLGMSREGVSPESRRTAEVPGRAVGYSA
jgi:GT2 family glycosyltransferase